jgi:hypothetical protein
MLPKRQTLDVFENEMPRIELRNYSQKIADKCIAGVIQNPLPYHRKALAGCPAKDDIHMSRPDASSEPNLSTVQSHDGLRQDLAIREIELVRCAMNGIDLNSRDDVEARLLETQTHSSGTCKEVDPDWPRIHPIVPFLYAIVLSAI